MKYLSHIPRNSLSPGLSLFLKSLSVFTGLNMFRIYLRYCTVTVVTPTPPLLFSHSPLFFLSLFLFLLLFVFQKVNNRTMYLFLLTRTSLNLCSQVMVMLHYITSGTNRGYNFLRNDFLRMEFNLRR
jgi:hypothetical protein